MVRVLLVAPYMENLAGVAQEIFAIERMPGLAVERLAPDAQRRELLHALQRREHDVLWLATHGDETGIALSDTDVLSAEDLIGLVRGAGLFGLVLNSCSSAQIAEMVHDATGVDVVCTVADVPDLAAWQAGVLFARYLGESGNFRTAFDLARPGGSTQFRYVPEYRESLIVAPDRSVFSSEELRTIYEAINGISQRLSVVEVELRYVRMDLDSRRGDLRVSSQWIIVTIGLLMSIAMFGLLYFVMGQL